MNTLRDSLFNLPRPSLNMPQLAEVPAPDEENILDLGLETRIDIPQSPRENIRSPKPPKITLLDQEDILEATQTMRANNHDTIIDISQLPKPKILQISPDALSIMLRYLSKEDHLPLRQTNVHFYKNVNSRYTHYKRVTPRKIEQMPNDTLQYIMSYLTPRERLTVRLVDQRFKADSLQSIKRSEVPPKLEFTYKKYHTFHETQVNHGQVTSNLTFLKIASALTVCGLIGTISMGIIIAAGLTINLNLSLMTAEFLKIVLIEIPILSVIYLSGYYIIALVISLFHMITNWMSWRAFCHSFQYYHSNVINDVLIYRVIGYLTACVLSIITVGIFGINSLWAIFITTTIITLLIMTLIYAKDLIAIIRPYFEKPVAKLATNINCSKDVCKDFIATNNDNNADIFPHYLEVVGYQPLSSRAKKINRDIHRAAARGDLGFVEKIAHKKMFFDIPHKLPGESHSQTLVERLLSLPQNYDNQKSQVIFVALMQSIHHQKRYELLTKIALSTSRHLIPPFLDKLYANRNSSKNNLNLLYVAVLDKDLPLVTSLVNLGANKDHLQPDKAPEENTPRKIVDALPDDGPQGVNTQLKYLFSLI